MPEILLGISGSEVKLPKGVRVGISVKVSKKISISEMSDGSERVSFSKIKRKWPLTWKPLFYNDKQALEDLHALDAVLHFQNQYESPRWYDVHISGFGHVDVMVAGVEKYIVTMDIEEVP